MVKKERSKSSKIRATRIRYGDSQRRENVALSRRFAFGRRQNSRRSPRRYFPRETIAYRPVRSLHHVSYSPPPPPPPPPPPSKRSIQIYRRTKPIIIVVTLQVQRHGQSLYHIRDRAWLRFRRTLQHSSHPEASRDTLCSKFVGGTQRESHDDTQVSRPRFASRPRTSPSPAAHSDPGTKSKWNGNDVRESPNARMIKRRTTWINLNNNSKKKKKKKTITNYVRRMRRPVGIAIRFKKTTAKKKQTQKGRKQTWRLNVDTHKEMKVKQVIRDP